MTGRRVAVVATAGALLLSGCGFSGLYSAPLPGGADVGDHSYKVTAYFDNALDLVPQSSVRVNDVAVGKVTAVSLADWSAKVTIQVNGSVNVPQNSTAQIQQTSLLGEKFVSIDAPTSKPSSARLGNGDTIGCPGKPKIDSKGKLPLCALNSTRSAAEVEQVLGALSLLFNEGGLRQIKVIGDELVTALKGREPQVKDLLTQLTTFTTTLDDNKSSIITALDRIDTLAKTLNRQKQILVDALDTYPAALKVLNDERGKLVKLLTSLDHLGGVASDVISKTQTGLTSALKSLDPALTQLRAAGDDFPQALKIAGTFPFPLGDSRQFVKGDYANLDAIVDADLSGVLCQLGGLTKTPALNPLCKGTTTSPLPSLPGAAGASAGGNSKRARPLQPMIVGQGR